MKSFIYLSDTHGMFHDSASVNAALKLTNILKPDIRIHGGDLSDFACLRKGASKSERATPIKEDLKFWRTFVKQWKPTVFLMGNHDYRLWRTSAEDIDDGLKKDAATNLCEEFEGTFENIDCKFYHYSKSSGVHKEGKLHFIHGFVHGENPLQKTLKKMKVSVVMGHTHAPQSATEPKYGEDLEGHVAGCMCDLELGYNATALETWKWRHGFIYGFIADNGDFICYHAKPVGGKWILPTEWKKL